ncbi:hypothetical protein MUY27_12595 [Mucilaginibacter sp. RS28]|uniref:Uncharacterized protein n=1 Tax=Mucilaginibacter straminoryzae TaxID=2932774 RepID=A0A9X1X3M3_9SPHI|nr:hypothetical protein [Mucilaginibacter straminoryzae]MCJ8210549.1 hypothetical protein [Mucilaginibacter straminoryzae]
MLDFLPDYSIFTLLKPPQLQSRIPKTNTPSHIKGDEKTSKSGIGLPAVPVFQHQAVIGMREAVTQKKSLSRPIDSYPGGQHPIQLKLKRWKPESLPTVSDHLPTSDIVPEQDPEAIDIAKKQTAADEGAQLVSEAVDIAHEQLENNDLSGAGKPYQDLYLLRLKEYKDGKKTMHPSTAAGYVIESKVTNRLAGQKGFNFQDTGLLTGTRPDIVIDLGNTPDGTRQTALVDITAQNSLSHIYLKKGNWTNHKHILYVAEAWYPTPSFSGAAAKLTPQQELEASLLANQKAKLAELQKKELLEYKTQVFLDTQQEICEMLIMANDKARKRILSNERSLAALFPVGLSLDDNGKPRTLTMEDRNELLDIPITSDKNPFPKFTQTAIDNAKWVIHRAKIAVGQQASKDDDSDDDEKGKKRTRRK